MRIAGIQRDSITNGVGIRDVIFMQGCSHHCKGCHNPQTWDYDSGEIYLTGRILRELKDSPNNITISGGEPFDQYNALYRLVVAIKKATGKSIWIYTGNTVDISKSTYRRLAPYVDVIVDGRYVEKLKDSELVFRGSSNQRIIDLPKSVKANKIVEWEDKYDEEGL